MKTLGATLLLVLTFVGCGSAPQSSNPPIAAPVPPVLAPGTHNVLLTWNPVAGVGRYTVYQLDPTGFPFHIIGTTSDLQYTVLSLEPSTYTFAVASEDSQGNSGPVAQVEVTVP
jgi:hypothetical protein